MRSTWVISPGAFFVRRFHRQDARGDHATTAIANIEPAAEARKQDVPRVLAQVRISVAVDPVFNNEAGVVYKVCLVVGDQRHP